jgi:hypothetical protein
MQYNKSPISLREGKAYIDGVEVMDSIHLEAIFTPDIWTGRTLGEKTPSTRWIGGAGTGSITRRRATPFLKEAIKKYLETGATPEFTIQGIQSDKNSDYYKEYGSETVTLVGCVMTGGLNLIQLDSESTSALEDVIGFNFKDIAA